MGSHLSVLSKVNESGRMLWSRLGWPEIDQLWWWKIFWPGRLLSPAIDTTDASTECDLLPISPIVDSYVVCVCDRHGWSVGRGTYVMRVSQSVCWFPSLIGSIMQQRRSLEVLMKSILGCWSGLAAPFISGQAALKWEITKGRGWLLNQLCRGAGPGSAARPLVKRRDNEPKLRWEQIDLLCVWSWVKELF